MGEMKERKWNSSDNFFCDWTKMAVKNVMMSPCDVVMTKQFEGFFFLLEEDHV